MEPICPPCYHHNYFLAIPILGHVAVMYDIAGANKLKIVLQSEC